MHAMQIVEAFFVKMLVRKLFNIDMEKRIKYFRS
jgi:hypothetical protein